MLESQDLLVNWLPLLLALIAVALGALCIGQFFSFRKSLRKEIAAAVTAARDFESLEARVAHLVAGMDELRERPADRPAPGSVAYSVDWAQETAGVNLEPRGQKTGAGLEMENLTASCRRCAPDMGFLLVSNRHSHAESIANQARTEILSCPFSATDLLDAVRTLSGTLLLPECEEACA